VIATLLMWPTSAAAQLKVLISSRFTGAYEQLLPEFERTSGILLTTRLFPRRGRGESVNVKVTPRGAGATAMVAAGDAELAVMPMSEILRVPGVDFAGTITAGSPLIQLEIG